MSANRKAAVPRTASTVMFVREATDAPFAVYMMRRNSRARFVPDAYVFPGGALDASDAAPASLACLYGLGSSRVAPELVFAAVRESFEEAGILLACDASGRTAAIPHARLVAMRRALDTGTPLPELLRTENVYADARALVYFSRWITPLTEPIRFDAHFFVARAPHDQVAEADAAEVHDGEWIVPQVALERRRAGTFSMIFPTIKHLERIAAFDSIDALLAFARSKSVLTVMPDEHDDVNGVVPEEVAERW